MFQSLFKKLFRRRKKNLEIAPDEIFIDAHNLPQFDTAQFEGRLETAISRKTIFVSAFAFLLICLIFFGRLWNLQVAHGPDYTAQSAENRLRHVALFPERGIIQDVNKVLLAWNVPSTEHGEFSSRAYVAAPGLGHVLGYISYPAKDSSGFFYSTSYEPHDGVEQDFNTILSGQNGDALIEINALGKINSESTVQYAQNGAALTLSIDSRLNTKLYESMKELAGRVGFTGGAAVVMDVTNGELLALTSFPEYDPNILTEGKDAKTIQSYNGDPGKPFLNRAIDGLYTPGSIVKPFMAVAALNEKVIDPATKILSTGSISITNPYDKTKTSVFNDWRPQGWIDMRDALAVSSDVYFYEVGGGFESQKGLGIVNIKKYMQTFGFGAPVPGDFSSNKAGVIPDPAWKEENFPGDPWRIGDTYHTAIGQYGFQVTPLQAVRAIASVANGGQLLTPTILDGGNDRVSFSEELPIHKEYFQIVREGMRRGVLSGISGGLNILGIDVAAKTGTAELGASKAFVNSWVIGFFPYDKPRFAFAMLMEHGPRANTFGSLSAMRSVFEWMTVNTPEYLR